MPGTHPEEVLPTRIFLQNEGHPGNRSDDLFQQTIEIRYIITLQ